MAYSSTNLLLNLNFHYSTISNVSYIIYEFNSQDNVDDIITCNFTCR